MSKVGMLFRAVHLWPEATSPWDYLPKDVQRSLVLSDVSLYPLGQTRVSLPHGQGPLRTPVPSEKEIRCPKPAQKGHVTERSVKCHRTGGPLAKTLS